MNAFVEIICPIYVAHLEKNYCVFAANLSSLKGKVFSENYNVLTTMDEIKLWKLTNFENYFS